MLSKNYFREAIKYVENIRQHLKISPLEGAITDGVYSGKTHPLVRQAQRISLQPQKTYLRK
jgi:hypothetical protein